MGCPCEIYLLADPAAEADLLQMARDEVHRFDRKYSHYRDDSIVGEINAAREPLQVDDETAGILNYAQTCYEASEGLFDITAGGLARVWHKDRRELPGAAEIAQALQQVGWHKVDWDGSSIHLPGGYAIDLGGVVKEYAADAAAAKLMAAGAESCLVNLGGDIALASQPRSTATWPIGISNPADRDQALVSVRMSKGAVVTSGSYERYVEIEGRQYSHLLDPRTGFPVSGPLSVTVISEFAVVAGSMATIAALQPETQALAWLDSQAVEYVLVDQSQQVHSTIVRPDA